MVSLIIVVAGLLAFFVVGNAIDRLLYDVALRMAKPSGDPLLDSLQLQPSRERGLVLNIIRPVVLTVIIFGGGALAIGLLGLGAWGAVASFAYFFFLTQIACLAGRKASLNVAGWSMVVSMVCVMVLYWVFK